VRSRLKHACGRRSVTVRIVLQQLKSCSAARLATAAGKTPSPAKAGAAALPRPGFAPAFCWRPSRVAADLLLARRLARKLDFEKELPPLPDGNPLVPPPVPAADIDKAPAGANDEPAAAAEGDADKAQQPASKGEL
jgi:hypothetical protein